MVDVGVAQEHGAGEAELLVQEQEGQEEVGAETVEEGAGHHLNRRSRGGVMVRTYQCHRQEESQECQAPAPADEQVDPCPPAPPPAGTCQEQEGGRSLQEDVADDCEGRWQTDCQEEQCSGQVEALLPFWPGISGQDVRHTHGSSNPPWGSPLY